MLMQQIASSLKINIQSKPATDVSQKCPISRSSAVHNCDSDTGKYSAKDKQVWNITMSGIQQHWKMTVLIAAQGPYQRKRVYFQLHRILGGGLPSCKILNQENIKAASKGAERKRKGCCSLASTDWLISWLVGEREWRKMGRECWQCPKVLMSLEPRSDVIWGRSGIWTKYRLTQI